MKPPEEELASLRARVAELEEQQQRPRVASSITELVGSTPLLRLGSACGEVLGKLEFLNPGGSVKDRAALEIVVDAERSGALRPGATLVDATSGNTGVALAMVAAARGYGCCVVMPRLGPNLERYALIRSYGGVVLLSEPGEGTEGMVALAEKACAALGDRAFFCRQFGNAANERAHYGATGPEIWAQCGGRLDAVVVGAGTGGTAAGVGKSLREAAAAAGRPPPRIVVVEPELSRVLSGGAHHNGHGITGIGAGVPLHFVAGRGDAAGHGKFVPDNFASVSLADALDTARGLARDEGVNVGPSSGAAVHVARLVAAELGPSSRVVAVLPSAGERYLTHPLFDAVQREARAELGKALRAPDPEAELRKLPKPAPRPPSGRPPVVAAARRLRRDAREALEADVASTLAKLLGVPRVPAAARLEDLGANSLTAARLLGKLAQAGVLADGKLPGAKVALIKVALLGSVRDLCRVLLRLDGDDDPLPSARAPEGFGVHVDYCGG